MLRTEKYTPFQIGFQNIRAQTCNINFSVHRLATDTDLTKHMKWFQNSTIPEKVKSEAYSDRTYTEIRSKSMGRQRSFSGFDNRPYFVTEKDFSVSGTKMDVNDSKDKSAKSKVWSQDISRSLPSVSECFTPIGLPVRQPLKRQSTLRQSHTTLGNSAGSIKLPQRPETRERPVTREQSMRDRPITRESRTRGRKKDEESLPEKLPSIIQEEPLSSDRDKYTQTSARRPPGGWRSLKDEPKSSRSTRSKASVKDKENIATPKFLPEVQSARDTNRRSEAYLPVEPLPKIFTPATAAAPGAGFINRSGKSETLTQVFNVTPDIKDGANLTVTPANTVDSSLTLTKSNRLTTGESSMTLSSQTLTPIERSASVKVRRVPVPFRTKVAHKTFLA